MPLVRVPQAHCSELSVCTEGCLTHYTLLMMITMVPHTHLRTWHRNLSSDSVVGEPIFPHNVHCHLERYLGLHYTSLPSAAKDIITGIDMFLHVVRGPWLPS